MNLFFSWWMFLLLTLLSSSALAQEKPSPPPTSTLILRLEGLKVVIGAGRAQGVQPGMILPVVREGKQIALVRVRETGYQTSIGFLEQVEEGQVVQVGEEVLLRGVSPPVIEIPPPQPPSELLKKLAEEGLENLVVESQPGSLRVEFENRVYRWEVDALSQVLQLASLSAQPRDELIITGKRINVPIYEFRVSNSAYQAFVKGLMPLKEFQQIAEVRYPPKEASQSKGINSSYGRVDLTTGLGLRGNLTSITGARPAELQVRARLGLESSLLKGTRLRLRQWFPFDSTPEFSVAPRPAQYTLEYTRQVGRGIYGTLSLGRFNEDYKGIRLDGYLIPSKLKNNIIGFQLAQVAPKDRFNLTSLLGFLRHQLPNADTALMIKGGRFLSKDTGITVSVVSSFRDRDFTIGFTDTSRGRFGFFGISWPIWTRKHLRPQTFRPRMENLFRFTYVTRAENVGAALPDLPFTDQWQDFQIPSNLPNYYEFLKPEEGGTPYQIKGMQTVPDEKILGPSLFGTTGLWQMPVAETLPYGYFSLSANFVRFADRPGWAKGMPGTVAHIMNVSLYPRSEFTLMITNVEGKLGVQGRRVVPGSTLGGFNIDRAVSTHKLLWKETRRSPAGAIGWQDIGISGLGTRLYTAKYLVLSKHIANWGIHLGFGSDRLKGVLFGLDHSITPKTRFLLDMGKTFRTFGIRGYVLPHLRADLYFTDFKRLGWGAAFIKKL